MSRPVVPRRAALALAGAVGLAGCSHEVAPAPVGVEHAYAPTPLPYPPGEVSDFAVCGGLALVCEQGGVALAGWGLPSPACV